MKKKADCVTCGGRGIVIFLVETRVGCGGWFASDGRVFIEDHSSCPTCDAYEGRVDPGYIILKA